jgi:antitoxin (DNA-binding transcriptional repressor) of toxin-antitoxin stability system
MREIKASEFKAKCLKLIDEVNATGEAIIITKRGKPVARVERLRSVKSRSLFGSMAGLLTPVDPNDNLFSAYSAQDLKAIEVNRKRRAAILDAPMPKRAKR